MIICPNPVIYYMARKLRLAELHEELRTAVREGDIEKAQAIEAKMEALEKSSWKDFLFSPIIIR